MSNMTICDNCAGCGVCSVICPKGAITIEANFEGFYHYKIDDSKCVHCGLCQKICPENNGSNNRGEIQASFQLSESEYDQKYYAARNNDLSCVMESSSGGVFSALAEAIIEKGGSVYGVVIEYPDCKIMYKRATRIEDIYLMRGSKYVQAELPKEILIQVIEDVKNNIPVLFTGTSCYVNGVKNLLHYKNIDISKLYFMDFVCAGVISTKLWNKEIDNFESKFGKIKQCSFRGKKYGWRDFSFFLKSDKLLKNTRFSVSNMGVLQTKKEALGMTCNRCQYSSYKRPGDITVGDFWNEQYLPRKWWDDKGASAILVNSSKGELLLKNCEKCIEMHSVEKQMVNNSRFELKSGEIDFAKRNELYVDAEKMEYEDFKKKWISLSIKDRVLLTLVRPLIIRLGVHRIIK